jgi:hypothetical protein
LLEHLEFGDIDNIIERTRQNEILKIRRELQKVESNDVSEEELAAEENKMLLAGDQRVTALPDDDHDLHISVHKQYEGNKLVDFHIEQHIVLKDAKREVERAAKSGELGEPNTPAIEEQVPPEIMQAGNATLQAEGQPTGAGVPAAVPPPPPSGTVGGVPAGEVPV